jgi:hypothetical protein
MKIEAIYRDEKEVTSTRSGENLRLRVTGGYLTESTRLYARLYAARP